MRNISEKSGKLIHTNISDIFRVIEDVEIPVKRKMNFRNLMLQSRQYDRIIRRIFAIQRRYLKDGVSDFDTICYFRRSESIRMT
jgi:CRP-like cAMP-binding protein